VFAIDIGLFVVALPQASTSDIFHRSPLTPPRRKSTAEIAVATYTPPSLAQPTTAPRMVKNYFCPQYRKLVDVSFFFPFFLSDSLLGASRNKSLSIGSRRAPAAFVVGGVVQTRRRKRYDWHWYLHNCPTLLYSADGSWSSESD
jgi:hypothetical protein